VTVVVKIGTSSLTQPNGEISISAIEKLTAEIVIAKKEFPEIVLVSSGAIGAGLADLGYDGSRPTDSRILQAASAVGQPKLMATYSRSFAKHGIATAQLLMTPDDFFVRKRYLHARSTVEELLSAGVLPIVNENDAIADDAIRWGDNDRIAALLAQLLNADHLVMLTDTDGVYTQDPNKKTSHSIELIREIKSFNQINATLGGSSGTLGSGGMESKLAAARMASWAGVTTTIGAATRENVVIESFKQSGSTGTIIYPQLKPLPAKKLWIAFAVQPKGKVVIDRGAQEAIEQHGGSLLAVGVLESDGEFDKGEAVEIFNEDAEIIARGLVSMNSNQLADYLRKKTDGVDSTNENKFVHRDELVVLTQ
jgi:glutamate 5-kinase